MLHSPIDLSSANAFNLEQSKILSFGKGRKTDKSNTVICKNDNYTIVNKQAVSFQCFKQQSENGDSENGIWLSYKKDNDNDKKNLCKYNMYKDKTKIDIYVHTHQKNMYYTYH